ncbi:hypothetical protein ACVWWJ_001859 [Luteibacter sp. HA06]
MFIIMVIACGVVLAAGLLDISRFPTQNRLFRWGIGFIVLGLCCSLLGPAYVDVANAPQADYLKNWFLIVASIGANLVAASTIQSKSNACACACSATKPGTACTQVGAAETPSTP